MFEYHDISPDDEMVVDSDGTIWITTLDGRWVYVISEGAASWDSFPMLPDNFIYAKLDDAAKLVIRKGLRLT